MQMIDLSPDGFLLNDDAVLQHSHYRILCPGFTAIGIPGNDRLAFTASPTWDTDL